MSTDEVLSQIKNIIFRFISPEEYNVFLFGSRASGTASKFSDYDIGIEGDKPLGSMQRFDIELELEKSDIPYKVEIVDFTQVDTNFKRVAKQHVIAL